MKTLVLNAACQYCKKLLVELFAILSCCFKQPPAKKIMIFMYLFGLQKIYCTYIVDDQIVFYPFCTWDPSNILDMIIRILLSRSLLTGFMLLYTRRDATMKFN